MAENKEGKMSNLTNTQASAFFSLQVTQSNKTIFLSIQGHLNLIQPLTVYHKDRFFFSWNMISRLQKEVLYSVCQSFKIIKEGEQHSINKIVCFCKITL